jgi:hypothetical protein
MLGYNSHSYCDHTEEIEVKQVHRLCCMFIVCINIALVLASILFSYGLQVLDGLLCSLGGGWSYSQVGAD